MAQAPMLLIIGLCFISGIRVSMTSFNPGCSFVDDQCVYSVQLGHQKQCDQIAGQDVNSTRCCDDVKDLVEEMRNRLNSLQKQIDLIQSTRDSTKHAGNDSSTGDATTDGEKLRLEQELQSLKQQLESERQTAASEARHLHDLITNKTRSLLSCQKAIGIQTAGNDGLGDMDSGNHTAMYCSFDDDMCGFKITSTSGSGEFDRLSTPLSGQGPGVDHSKGIARGSVLGLDTNAVATNDRVYRDTLKSFQSQSPVFPATSSPYCIRFWYWMKGSDAQDLEVNVYIKGGAGYPVLKFHGQQSPSWQLATLELDSEYTSNEFQIGFRLTTRAYRKYYSSGRYTYYNRDGSIAVDDLYVYNTSCAAVPRYPPNAYRKSFNGSTSFYTFHTEAHTWKEAYDVCRRESPWTGLVSIQSAEEQQFLVDTIKNDTTLSLVGQSGFYTSGTDRDVEHKFVWTDKGEPEVVPTGFWHTGQPNNVAGNQDCLLMQYATDDYRWGDIDCDTRHSFICESH